jgi:hypothetical protein
MVLLIMQSSPASHHLPGERTLATHWGGMGGPRAGLDAVPETDPGNPNHCLVSILTELSWLQVQILSTLYQEN